MSETKTPGTASHYLLAHNANAAVGEFQKLVEHRGIVLSFVTGALAYLQLGRAYAMAGDTAKAKTAYQDFFALWKAADPDIQMLGQAKTEYANLRSKDPHGRFSKNVGKVGEIEPYLIAKDTKKTQYSFVASRLELFEEHLPYCVRSYGFNPYTSSSPCGFGPPRGSCPVAMYFPIGDISNLGAGRLRTSSTPWADHSLNFGINRNYEERTFFLLIAQHGDFAAIGIRCKLPLKPTARRVGGEISYSAAARAYKRDLPDA